MKVCLIFSLCLASALVAEDPESLKTLRSNYEDALERAVQPVNDRYVKELEKLKLQYTKAGKLEEALAVDAELKKQTASKSTPKATIVGKWQYHRDGEDKPFTQVNIDADGSAISERSQIQGKWTLEDGKVTIKWSNGFVYTIPFNENEPAETLNGTDNKGTPFTLKRDK